MTNESMDRSSTLKAYYSRYLQEVRGLTVSSVRHYIDALNNVSRRLVQKGLVQVDVYEISDYEYLHSVRDILYADPDFIALNERGRRMYSAGLNNYLRFAAGTDFSVLFGKMGIMDIPMQPEIPFSMEQTKWKRSNILRIQTLMSANYMCEIDESHHTFIAENTGKPYMESHHLVPISLQPQFKKSLDVYANIICLCPICHRKIHYGLKGDKASMVQAIYPSRADRLAKSGIMLSQSELLDIVTV